jgi:parallel beta-helix repeat protein
MKTQSSSSKIRSSVSVLIFAGLLVFLMAEEVRAAQIGNPASLVFVSQGSWAADNENCGYTPWRTCRTIQHAVYRVRAGGIIAVFPGTYQENILVDKRNIIIASFGGKERTIIDGSGATDETVSEAMRVITDGVTVGWRNSSRNGFTFRNSVASGLFNVGSNIIISGNAAENNGARGFQFGLSSVDDSIDTSNKDIPDDPLNGATKMVDAALQTQSHVTVNNNTATDNALGGFYFSAFDDSIIRNNTGSSNRGQPGLGQGSGFWIDSGSNRDRVEGNTASNNSGDGIFFRRGFGAEPAGLVTDQTTIRNITRSNGRNGIFLMGNNIVAQDNLSEANQADGFRVLGFDTVRDISYNTAIGNLRAGIGFDGRFANFSNPLVLPLNFDDNGVPVEFGGVHHNIFVDNQDYGFADPNNDFTRCGIANTLDNGTTIEISHNFWGDDQNICDSSGTTIVQFTPLENRNAAGVRPARGGVSRRLSKINSAARDGGLWSKIDSIRR